MGDVGCEIYGFCRGCFVEINTKSRLINAFSFQANTFAPRYTDDSCVLVVCRRGGKGQDPTHEKKSILVLLPIQSHTSQPSSTNHHGWNNTVHVFVSFSLEIEWSMMLIVVLLFASHVLVEQSHNNWTSPPIIFRWLGNNGLTMGLRDGN